MKMYGLPYMGSKNFIATRIARDLPSAENYYDLFCGGGAVLQAVLESKKFKNHCANELNSLVCDGLVKAFSGAYQDEKRLYRWIEEFSKNKTIKIFISEYFMPADKIRKIRSYPKISTMTANAKNRAVQTDNLYIPIKQDFDDPLKADILPIFKDLF